MIDSSSILRYMLLLGHNSKLMRDHHACIYYSARKFIRGGHPLRSCSEKHSNYVDIDGGT